MLRAFLSAVVVATGLFFVAPGAADAQFAPLAMEIHLYSTWDVTVTGNTRVRCRGQLDGSEEPASIRLEPDVGATSWSLRRFYCGDVALDLFVEMTTRGLKSEPHTVYPEWGEIFVQLNVVYDTGAGAQATVLEYQNTIVPKDGWDIPYPYPRPTNTPGVVINAVTDRMVAWLTP